MEKEIRVIIRHDNDAESPREWDNLGTMVCFHNRYDLGDKHNFYDPEDFEASIDPKKAIILPLYLYDHSGITISTGPFSSMWDSGKVGYIYVTYENLRKEYNVKNVTKKIREKVIRQLEAEVEIYDMYLTGQVYWFVIEEREVCECCGHEEWKNIDSCGGFYGSDWKTNGMIEYIPKEYHQFINDEIRYDY